MRPRPYYNVIRTNKLMLRVLELEWDDWNETHIAKHGVSREEVEDICFSRHWALRARGKGRMAIFGQASGGHYLLVIVERTGPGLYRPITAREMDPTERRRFQAWRGRR